MNLIQTFRRIGQKAKGWSVSLDMQDFQLALIKKLYNRNGLNLVRTSCAFPEQYNVFKGERQVAYYRLRDGEFRVDFTDCSGETIYKDYPFGDGIFEEKERLIYLTTAMRKVLEKLNSEQGAQVSDTIGMPKEQSPDNQITNNK